MRNFEILYILYFRHLYIYVSKYIKLYLQSNSFYGSLAPLRNLSELYNTNLDSGLEYLPNSLKFFSCETPKDRPEIYFFSGRYDGVRSICELFKNDKGEIEWESNQSFCYQEIWVKNFSTKFQNYKRTKLQEARELLSAEISNLTKYQEISQKLINQLKQENQQLRAFLQEEKAKNDKLHQQLLLEQKIKVENQLSELQLQQQPQIVQVPYGTGSIKN